MNKKNQILIIIPARGGSKRMPKKNINLQLQGQERQQQAQNKCDNTTNSVSFPITCGVNNIIDEESNYLLEPSYQNIDQNDNYANVNSCNGKSSISEESILEDGWTYLPKEIDKVLEKHI